MIALALGLATAVLLADSTGNVMAGAGTSVDRAGSTAWTNPGNIVSDNATDATCATPCDYLIAAYDFDIPAGATVAGVTVRVEATETGSGSSNYVPQLCSNTTPTLIGSAKTAVGVTNGPVISSNGGAADLWGAALTPSIVNANGFCVALWSTDTTNTLLIDFVTMAIDYTVPATINPAFINSPVRGGGELRFVQTRRVG